MTYAQERKPRRLVDYRILAVRDARDTKLVGKLFTVMEVNPVGWPDHMWSVKGRVHGTPGEITLVAALGKETGNCLCSAYEFPHQKTRSCK